MIKVRPYLLSAVKYRLVRSIQSSKRKEELSAIGLDVEPTTELDDLELKELKKIIALFQDTLPEKARHIFQLSRNEHFSNKEIAKTVAISEKTVGNQMTISLRKLRLALHRLSVMLMFV